MTRLSFYVHGTPGAQGSKRHVGGGVMVESSKKVKPWRQDVVAAALDAMTAFGDVDEFAPLAGPVAVNFQFIFPRPKSHYGTGRNASNLKASAPSAPISRSTGDADKLARSTCDALVTAGVIADDSLIVDLHVTKTYGTRPGAHIVVASTGERP